MPQKNREAYLAYQCAYYVAHRKQLAARAKMRKRIKLGTKLLWHILPEPRGFCSAMAQKAIAQWAGPLPTAITKEDLEQDIAEALVYTNPADTYREPLQYAASLAIKVALRSLSRAQKPM